ncbi:AAA family ATPase [Kitasatospora sp. NBC_00240]|uniref:ParA family protein n=1 Tax=Kitasatospora sp. NBC_00240 TaxID=2903567 RepID=UPI002B1D8874|nr:AAA family ATPase [Kitasatospora sp. NBC_00240]
MPSILDKNFREDCSKRKHMVGERQVDLRELLMQVDGDSFGDRLHLLPACTDGFLLDAKLVTSREVRVKETALEKALTEQEKEFDFVIVDCPPSLGYAMDNAPYYGTCNGGINQRWTTPSVAA